jgi:hypothetical protein
MSAAEMLTAIVQDVEESGKRVGRKYHNVKNNDKQRQKFESFARGKFPRAFMVMYYDHTRAEVGRAKLK